MCNCELYNTADCDYESSEIREHTNQENETHFCITSGDNPSDR